jgi:Ca2+-binding RTX toxin-like protein
MSHALLRRTAGIAAPILGAAFLLPVSTASAAPYTCDGRPATIVGTDRNDEIEGTPGNDVIVGLGGNDVIHGRGGDDVICAFRDWVRGQGNRDGRKDKLFGDGGNDLLSGNWSNDIASGGAGDDAFEYVRVDYRGAPGSVSVDLEEGVGTGWGHDTYLLVRVVHGSRFGDTLRGRNENCGDSEDCPRQSLYGHGGDDVLVGFDGNDNVLHGGAGADHLEGGDGSDTLYPGPGRDLVEEGTVSYELVRRNMFVDLRSGVARGQGLDTLVRIENVTGSPLADVIHGDGLGNYLLGGGGADLIRGHAGDDYLVGDTGNDRLLGGPGSDQAYGRSGNDFCRAERTRSC